MGFWIFMLIMTLALPITMIVLGRKYMTNPPREISSTSGYRSARSMKNRESWEYAHRVCGKKWFICGMILLPLAVIAMLFFLGKPTETVGWAGGVIVLIETIPMIASCVLTEAALKREFEDDM